MRAQWAGSSVFGCFRVTSPSTVTASPCLRRVMTSLLMWAWARTLTLFCLETAGALVASGATVISSDLSFFLGAGFFFGFLAAGLLVVGAGVSGGAGATAGAVCAGGGWAPGGAGKAGGVASSASTTVKPVKSTAAQTRPCFIFIMIAKLEI